MTGFRDTVVVRQRLLPESFPGSCARMPSLVVRSANGGAPWDDGHSRSRSRIAVAGYHLPPATVAIPRRFSSAAAWVADMLASSARTGRMRSAKASPLAGCVPIRPSGRYAWL